VDYFDKKLIKTLKMNKKRINIENKTQIMSYIQLSIKYDIKMNKNYKTTHTFQNKNITLQTVYSVR